MTRLPEPNDDPALEVSALWNADCDRLEEAVHLAAMRERVWLDAMDDNRPEAERLYVAAARVRDQWCDRIEAKTQAVFRIPAQSFEGVAAKVAVLLRDSAPSPDDPMPPWTYLRSVKCDLDRLVATLKDAAANDEQPGR
jgi:hypothetical protein